MMTEKDRLMLNSVKKRMPNDTVTNALLDLHERLLIIEHYTGFESEIDDLKERNNKLQERLAKLEEQVNKLGIILAAQSGAIPIAGKDFVDKMRSTEKRKSKLEAKR